MNVEESRWNLNRLLYVLMDDCLINNSCSKWRVDPAPSRLLPLAPKTVHEMKNGNPCSELIESFGKAAKFISMQMTKNLIRWSRSHRFCCCCCCLPSHFHTHIDVAFALCLPRMCIRFGVKQHYPKTDDCHRIRIALLCCALLCLFWLTQNERNVLNSILYLSSCCSCARTHTHTTFTSKNCHLKSDAAWQHNARRSFWKFELFVRVRVSAHMWKPPPHIAHALSRTVRFYSPTRKLVPHNHFVKYLHIFILIVKCM